MRQRCTGRSTHLLHGNHRRRALEDHRRWGDLGPGDRRPGALRIGRGRGGEREKHDGGAEHDRRGDRPLPGALGLVAVRAELVELWIDQTGEDPAVLEILRPIIAEVADKMNAVVGEIRVAGRRGLDRAFAG